MIQFIRTLLSIVIFMPLSGMHFRYEDNYASLARSILFEHNVIGNSFDAVEKAVKVIDSYFPLHIFTSTCHSCVIPDQARIFKNVIVDSLSCFISSSSSIISKLELVYDILNLKIPNENIEIATNNILIILSQLLFDSDGAPCEQTTKLTLSHAKNIVHNISHLCTSTSDYLHTIKSLEGKDSNLDLVVHEVIALYKKCAHELLTGTRIQHTLPVCVGMHTNSSSQPYTDFKQKIVNNSITVSLLKVIECLKRGDYEQSFKIAKEQGVFEYLPSLKHALRVKITQITEKKWGISSNKLAEISQESYARAQPIAIAPDTQYAPLSETHRDQLRLYKDTYEQSLISADKDPTVSLETEKRMHAIDMTLEGPLEKNETYFYNAFSIDSAVLDDLAITEECITSSSGTPIHHELHQESLRIIDHAVKMKSIVSSDIHFAHLKDLYQLAAEAAALAIMITKTNKFDKAINTLDWAQALMSAANELYRSTDIKISCGINYRVSSSLSHINTSKVEQATVRLLQDPLVVLAIPPLVRPTSSDAELISGPHMLGELQKSVSTFQNNFYHVDSQECAVSHKNVINQFQATYKLATNTDAERAMTQYMVPVGNGIIKGVRNAFFGVYDAAIGIYEIVTHAPEIVSLVQYAYKNPVQAAKNTLQFAKTVIFDSSTEAKIEFAVAFKVEQLTRMGLSASVPYIRLVGLLPVAKKAIRNFADSLKIVRKNREFITSIAGPAIKYTVHASDNIHKDFNQLKQDLNRVINAACKKSLRIAGNSGIHNIIDHHLTQKLINNYGHNLVEQAAHIVGTYHNFFDKLGNAEKLQKAVARLKKIYSYSFGKSYLNDNGIGGTIRFGTIQEAQAAIACQEQGILRSLTRAINKGDDFIEDLGSGIVRRWDVKTPTSFAVNDVWKNNFQGEQGFWRALVDSISNPGDHFIINITDLVSEHLDEFFSGLKKHCSLADLNRMVIVHAEKPGLSMTTQHLVNWYLFD